MLDELLTSASTALAEASQERPRPPRAIINSRDVVARCLDHSQDLHRRPLMHELCRAAGVSERMVRKAFVDTFDLPPSVYFFHRALSRAQQRLAHGGAEEDTVTTIALDAGFEHVGRFARRYRDVYGEPPSQTLRRRYTRWSTG